MKARARLDWDVADQQEAIDTVASWGLHEGVECTLMVEQAGATPLPSTVLAPVNTEPVAADSDGTVTITPDDPPAVPPMPPTAEFTYSPASPTAGDDVAFDATGSTPSSAPIVRYDWTWGDGDDLPDGGPTPTHTYADPGGYAVALTVTDEASLVSTTPAAIITVA